MVADTSSAEANLTAQCQRLPYIPNTHKYTPPGLHTLIIIDVVLACVTVFSNVCLLVFVCGHKKSRTTHNVTVVNVSVAGVVTSLVVVPTRIGIMMFNSQPGNDVSSFMCKMSHYLDTWLRTVVVYSLLGMAVNRYVKVVSPHSSSKMAGRCMFYLNFVWFSGAAYNIWQVMINSSRYIKVGANISDISASNESLEYLYEYFVKPDTQYEHPGTDSVPETLVTVEEDNPFESVYDYDMRYNLTDIPAACTMTRMCITSLYFRGLHWLFVYSDLVVVYIIPGLIFLYLYSSLLIHAWNCREVTIQKYRGRVAMTLTFTAVFYLFALPGQIVLLTFSPFDEVSTWSVTCVHLAQTWSYATGIANIIGYVITSSEIRTNHRRRHKTSINNRSKRDRLLVDTEHRCAV